LPADIAKSGCPPEDRAAEMGDFFVTQLYQMASCLSGAELLVDKDRGTFESEIRINGYQGDISTDILEIA
jgi:hypothetical protein